jgi:hypothetical protein
MKSLKVATLVALIASPFMAFAQTERHPLIDSKYLLDVGLFFPERTVSLGAGVSVPGDGRIDFGSEFGLNKTDELFAVDLTWRFGEKWSLAAQHFRASGGREAVLENDIEWNNVVFSAGSSVETSTRFSVYRLFAGRSFSNDERSDYGVGAGLHWLEVGGAISGNIFVNNNVTFTREAVSAEAPLPNIGAWYNYSFSPRWAFKARLDWFSANIDEYNGRLLNWQVGVNYALFSKGGVGVAYNYLELDAGVDNSNWQGSVDLVYKGPFAFVSFYW